METTPTQNTTTTPTPITATPSAAPVIPTPPAAAQGDVPTPTQTVRVEIARYPMLKSMINVFRLLAVVFMGVALLLCLIQLFIADFGGAMLGNMLLFLLIGFFEAIVCFTLAEGITVLLDIEKQTRPASIDAELNKTISIS